MKTSALVHISSAHQGSSSVLKFSRIQEWVCKAPRVGYLYVLSAVIASISVGITANSSVAQTYYPVPISTTNGDGYVLTSSGIGLNIRSGPGLGYSIIGGADDGEYLNLTGPSVDADGYRWQQIQPRGWVATEYIAGNASYPGEPCYCNTTAVGGPAQPVQQAAIRPISTTNPGGVTNAGPYIVAVPGSDARTITQVRRLVGRGYVDRAREGNFVNAGNYSDYDTARALTHLLRSNGLDARVIYR